MDFVLLKTKRLTVKDIIDLLPIGSIGIAGIFTIPGVNANVFR